MKRGWLVPALVCALLLGGALIGGWQWSRSVAAQVAAGEVELAQMGFPLTLEQLEDDYRRALLDRSDPATELVALVRRVGTLSETDWPDDSLEAALAEEEGEPARGPSEAVRDVLVRHRGLLRELRVALESHGRRLDLPLDPLSDDTEFQAGFNALVEFTLWEAEKLVADGAPVGDVVAAYRLALEVSDLYAAVPNTIAQMQRVAWCQRVWTGIRPALERYPVAAATAFERLTKRPISGAARRALVPQATLVAQVDAMFESGASAGSGPFELPSGGNIWWLWERPGIVQLYAHLARVAPLLEAGDLSGLEAVEREVMAELDEKGSLFKLLYFNAVGILEAELAQRDDWLVTRTGAQLLGQRAAEGAWPAELPSGEGAPRFEVEGADLTVRLGESSWTLPGGR